MWNMFVFSVLCLCICLCVCIFGLPSQDESRCCPLYDYVWYVSYNAGNMEIWLIFDDWLLSGIWRKKKKEEKEEKSGWKVGISIRCLRTLGSDWGSKMPLEDQMLRHACCAAGEKQPSPCLSFLQPSPRINTKQQKDIMTHFKALWSLSPKIATSVSNYQFIIWANVRAHHPPLREKNMFDSWKVRNKVSSE